MTDTTNLPPMPDPSAQPASTSSAGQGHKKALLQKLMDNLLGKPGRSMHEIIDGVKQAMGAYKNYSKEWDTLHGVLPGATAGAAGAVGAGVAGGAAKDNIRNIMDQIQTQKAKASPTPLPSMPQPAQAVRSPWTHPFGGYSGQGSTAPYGNMGQGVQPVGQPQTPPPSSQGKISQNYNPVSTATGTYINQGVADWAAKNPPPKMTPSLAMTDPTIAGQPQTSTFNRPAPVSNLGIHGF